eukprot:gene5092-3169_t
MHTPESGFKQPFPLLTLLGCLLSTASGDKALCNTINESTATFTFKLNNFLCENNLDFPNSCTANVSVGDTGDTGDTADAGLTCRTVCEASNFTCIAGWSAIFDDAERNDTNRTCNKARNAWDRTGHWGELHSCERPILIADNRLCQCVNGEFILGGADNSVGRVCDNMEDGPCYCDDDPTNCVTATSIEDDRWLALTQRQVLELARRHPSVHGAAHVRHRRHQSKRSEVASGGSGESGESGETTGTAASTASTVASTAAATNSTTTTVTSSSTTATSTLVSTTVTSTPTSTPTSTSTRSSSTTATQSSTRSNTATTTPVATNTTAAVVTEIPTSTTGTPGVETCFSGRPQEQGHYFHSDTSPAHICEQMCSNQSTTRGGSNQPTTPSVAQPIWLYAILIVIAVVLLALGVCKVQQKCCLKSNRPGRHGPNRVVGEAVDADVFHERTFTNPLFGGKRASVKRDDSVFNEPILAASHDHHQKPQQQQQQNASVPTSESAYEPVVTSPVFTSADKLAQDHAYAEIDAHGGGSAHPAHPGSGSGGGGEYEEWTAGHATPTGIEGNTTGGGANGAYNTLNDPRQSSGSGSSKGARVDAPSTYSTLRFRPPTAADESGNAYNTLSATSSGNGACEGAGAGAAGVHDLTAYTNMGARGSTVPQVQGVQPTQLHSTQETALNLPDSAYNMLAPGERSRGGKQASSSPPSNSGGNSSYTAGSESAYNMLAPGERSRGGKQASSSPPSNSSSGGSSSYTAGSESAYNMLAPGERSRGGKQASSPPPSNSSSGGSSSYTAGSESAYNMLAPGERSRGGKQASSSPPSNSSSGGSSSYTAGSESAYNMLAPGERSRDGKQASSSPPSNSSSGGSSSYTAGSESAYNMLAPGERSRGGKQASSPPPSNSGGGGSSSYTAGSESAYNMLAPGERSRGGKQALPSNRNNIYDAGTPRTRPPPQTYDLQQQLTNTKPHAPPYVNVQQQASKAEHAITKRPYINVAVPKLTGQLALKQSGSAATGGTAPRLRAFSASKPSNSKLGASGGTTFAGPRRVQPQTGRGATAKSAPQMRVQTSAVMKPQQKGRSGIARVPTTRYTGGGGGGGDGGGGRKCPESGAHRNGGTAINTQPAKPATPKLVLKKGDSTPAQPLPSANGQYGFLDAWTEEDAGTYEDVGPPTGKGMQQLPVVKVKCTFDEDGFCFCGTAHCAECGGEKRNGACADDECTAFGKRGGSSTGETIGSSFLDAWTEEDAGTYEDVGPPTGKGMQQLPVVKVKCAFDEDGFCFCGTAHCAECGGEKRNGACADDECTAFGKRGGSSTEEAIGSDGVRNKATRVKAGGGHESVAGVGAGVGAGAGGAADAHGTQMWELFNESEEIDV